MNNLNTLSMPSTAMSPASLLGATSGAAELPRSAGEDPKGIGTGTARGTTFGEALAEQAETSKAHDERMKQADDAAAGLVSAALILPILKQVRRSTFGGDGPFSPGIGEKTFGPQFDMQLADRIAHSPRLGVKNALVARMLKKVPAAEMKTTGLDVHG